MDQTRIDAIKLTVENIEAYIGEDEPPSIIADCKDMIEEIEAHKANLQVKATEYDTLNGHYYEQNQALRDMDVDNQQARAALTIWGAYVAAVDSDEVVHLLIASEKFTEGKQALIDLGFLDE